jgi:hypothetical protein
MPKTENLIKSLLPVKVSAVILNPTWNVSSSHESVQLKILFKKFARPPVPEILDPVFAKTSQNARFLLSENERFGLVFVKTGSINSGTDQMRLVSHPAQVAGRTICASITVLILGSLEVF